MMPNDGMSPTIALGERVNGRLGAYDEEDPQMGDLVIFRPFGHPGRRWVFRVAGVPGDRMGYAGGVLTRNGVVVTSPAFDVGRTFPSVPGGADVIGTLGAGEYFLLSDDPEHGDDSRVWGLVRREWILGKVTSHR